MANNREKIRAYHANYRANNRGKVRAWHTKYRANNREKIRARDANFRANNRENLRAWQVRYHADNPEKSRAKDANRRALIAKAEGHHTGADIKFIYAHYNYTCVVPRCNKPAEHMDHIVPIARGGTNWPDNLQPLCEYHNLSKGTNTIDYRPDSGVERWHQTELFREPV